MGFLTAFDLVKKAFKAVNNFIKSKVRRYIPI